MKKIFIIITLLITGISQYGYSQNDNSREELVQLLNEFLKGAGENNAKMHDRFWAEDLIYTSSSGERFGKEKLMQGVRQSNTVESDNNITWSAEDIQINIYGDMAVLAFQLVGKGNSGDVVNTYLNSGTFIKRNEFWKAVNWQATKE